MKLGIIPGCGGTQNLPRALGERRAKELILNGTPFSADDAMKWGMVNRVCEPDKLLDEALATAQRIAGNGPIAVRQAKHAIHHGIEMSVANGMLFEVQAYNRTVPTEDRHEGVRAFNEKRKPDFKESNASDANESHPRPPALVAAPRLCYDEHRARNQ